MTDVATTAAERAGRDPGDEGGRNRAEDADLLVFVDRLAAAGSDRPTTAARDQIRRAVDAGCAPPGLRRLAEALAASVAELPPPRRAAEDAASVVPAMRENALVVIEEVDTAAVAVAIGALLADGRRVVVTAATSAELSAVRDALPGGVADRALDRLPALPSGELRELRRLLATSTPARRSRPAQRLPAADDLPLWEQVAQLCGRAGRASATAPSAGIVPVLLGELGADRRAAITEVARFVLRSVGALPPRRRCDWAWTVLSHLIYGRHRPVFDRMLEDTAQSLAGLEHARRGRQVSVIGPLPAGAGELVERYVEFVASGGRTRPYFRSPAQRDVQPVLRVVRVDDRVPDTEEEIARVLEHIHLGERLARIDAGCAELGIRAPRDESDLVELAGNLVRVAAAARAVGALRHDVLFLAPDCPLSVPDVAAAEQVARAVLDFAENGSGHEAGRHLDRMAEELAGRAPAATAAPEHVAAVRALRGRDAAAYGAAVEALSGARRDARDEARQEALLRRLGHQSPRLEQAWRTLAEHDPAALGLACFVLTDALLTAMPALDSADVVVVLGAAQLGVERLLLAGVAPRLIAVVAPGERPEPSPSLLSVLRRASALVIRAGRAGPAARVVPISRSAPVVPHIAPVGRVGA